MTQITFCPFGQLTNNLLPVCEGLNIPRQAAVAESSSDRALGRR